MNQAAKPRSIQAKFPMNDEPQAATKAEGRDYSKTLFLPQTDFPMRAGLPQKEPETLARWTAIDLYRRMRATAGAGRNSCSMTARLMPTAISISVMRSTKS